MELDSSDSTQSIKKFIVKTGIQVIQDSSNSAAASSDFGNLVSGNSRGIIQPQNITELQSVLQFASDEGIPVTPRGRGYSQGGQSLSSNGFTLDITPLNFIGIPDIESKTITCEAGAKWQDIVAVTSKNALLPKVLPLNLEQTVGGLLSTAGIGSTSHTYGPIIANVVSLDVVTGTGNLIQCSKDVNRDLYDAVLGGLGRYGVIARATLMLREIKPYIRTFHLLYDSLDSWIHDQKLLTQITQINHLEGFCWSSAKGIRNTSKGRQFFAHWLYGLQIGVEYQKTPPSIDDLTKELHYSKLIHIENEPILDHVFRYQPRFDMMRHTGMWNQTHPWIDCFISAKALAEILPDILDTLPLSLGDGHRMLRVNNQNIPSFFMVPPGDDIVCFAILPVGVKKSDTTIITALEQVNQMLLDAGGKRYLSGWLGNSYDLRQHYGNKYNTLVALKNQYDPQNILNFHNIALGN